MLLRQRASSKKPCGRQMRLRQRASSMRPLLPHLMAVGAQPARGAQPAGTGMERRTALGCTWYHQHQQPCSLCKLLLHLLQPGAGCPSLHSMKRQGQVSSAQPPEFPEGASTAMPALQSAVHRFSLQYSCRAAGAGQTSSVWRLLQHYCIDKQLCQHICLACRVPPAAELQCCRCKRAQALSAACSHSARASVGTFGCEHAR